MHHIRKIFVILSFKCAATLLCPEYSLFQYFADKEPHKLLGPCRVTSYAKLIEQHSEVILGTVSPYVLEVRKL